MNVQYESNLRGKVFQNIAAGDACTTHGVCFKRLADWDTQYVSPSHANTHINSLFYLTHTRTLSLLLLISCIILLVVHCVPMVVTALTCTAVTVDTVRTVQFRSLSCSITDLAPLVWPPTRHIRFVLRATFAHNDISIGMTHLHDDT